jgi:NAD(P)H dehydrogenase (quinone)
VIDAAAFNPEVGMIVVMGATGQTGGAVLKTLKERGVAVRAVSRDPTRAASVLGGDVELVRGDPSDEASLAAAFEGAEAAYVMAPPRMDATDVLAEGRATARAIAGAVAAARVPHVVMLSSAGAHLAEGSGIVRTLHDLEAALRGAAPSLALLRAADFMENWAPMLTVAREAGVLPSARMPLDAKGESVSALDVGRTAAELLLEPRPGTRIVNIVAPHEYSPVDAAAILSRLLARPVAAVPADPAESEAALQAAGASADFARLMSELYASANVGRVGFEAGVGETRRGKVTLEQVLERLLG